MKMKKNIGVVIVSGCLSLNIRIAVADVKINIVEKRSSPANKSPNRPSKNVRT